MTYEEVKKRITGIVSNPDTAQADALDLLKDIEADYTTMDTLRTRATEDAEKIRTLQDTNARLFLGQTTEKDNTSGGEELDETDGQAFIDNYFDNIAKEN